MLLKDRVAIVTGGAVGIGRGIARKFAGEGCAVAIADISDEGQKTIDGILQNGGKGLFIKCDVTDNRQVQDMVNKTVSEFGRVDILVNNAGGLMGRRGGTIETVDEENWDRIVDLNLKSQFFCCKAVVPHMKKNKYGKIINISSMGATHPPASIIHYHSAKGGVLGLTTNLALELAHLNITVNAILPGPIRSEFYNEMLKSIPDEEAFFTRLGNNVPMQRIGTPEDIAGVALFLASELSAYVTAESICVGGGLPLPPLNIRSTE